MNAMTKADAAAAGHVVGDDVTKKHLSEIGKLFGASSSSSRAMLFHEPAPLQHGRGF